MLSSFVPLFASFQSLYYGKPERRAAFKKKNHRKTSFFSPATLSNDLPKIDPVVNPTKPRARTPEEVTRTTNNTPSNLLTKQTQFKEKKKKIALLRYTQTGGPAPGAVHASQQERKIDATGHRTHSRIRRCRHGRREPAELNVECSATRRSVVAPGDRGRTPAGDELRYRLIERNFATSRAWWH